ncbi:MAG: hypothetical protein OXE05_11685 [Chloroflexi bacterium]|nr:hypothetical protein [Chloroflexota bacterium]
MPIGIDLLIWFGPRIMLGAELLPLAEGSPSTLEAGASPESANIFTIVSQSNLLSLILGIWVPSLGVAVSGEGPGATIVLDSFQQFLLALVLLLPVSFLLGGTYLALIAAEVQQSALPWEVLLPRVLRLTNRLGGLVGVMLVATLVPFAVASLMLSLVPLIGALLLLLAVALLLWVAFYVFFIVDSVALVRQSLPKVIRLTLDVIHANLWSSVGFFFLYWLIVFGTSILWGPILGWEILSISIGRIIATIGNAYVGTWVTIALFMYVWNRLLIHRGDPSSA